MSKDIDVKIVVSVASGKQFKLVKLRAQTPLISNGDQDTAPAEDTE